ncbi:hypothetical protein [Aureimonas jatrophae]|uniref:hypothetical protein n=1 Tax=Aureimonas jatrophae TaxID=1166073 RepID=UPI0011135CDF|nr:hypothetical protein [Aureimonas jatrophae]MBB3952644.1 hypothetical protein [Aureimonas jatrophae]
MSAPVPVVSQTDAHCGRDLGQKLHAIWCGEEHNERMILVVVIAEGSRVAAESRMATDRNESIGRTSHAQIETHVLEVGRHLLDDLGVLRLLVLGGRDTVELFHLLVLGAPNVFGTDVRQLDVLPVSENGPDHVAVVEMLGSEQHMPFDVDASVYVELPSPIRHEGSFRMNRRTPVAHADDACRHRRRTYTPDDVRWNRTGTGPDPSV